MDQIDDCYFDTDDRNLNNAPSYYEAGDELGDYHFEGEEFTSHHPTWGALQFERRVRGLEELPWV